MREGNMINDAIKVNKMADETRKTQIQKGSSLCWQITMTAEECERSGLAMEAIKRL